MLIHFLNNAISTYQTYAVAYSLPFHELINGVYDLLVTNIALVASVAGLIIGCGVLLFWLIISICDKNDAKERAKIKAEREKNGEMVTEVSLPFEDKIVYRPVLRDWIFYIGGFVLMAITTFCTFLWRI